MLEKIKELFAYDYIAKTDNELINLFISATKKSSIAYACGTLIYVWFLYDFIPLIILVPWTVTQLCYPLLRMYLANKYKNTVFNTRTKIKFQYQHMTLALLGGLMWGMGSVLCFIYAPSPYEYMVLTLIVGLSAGALTTLSSLYPVYLAYSLPSLILLLISFILYADGLHYAIALMVGIFTFIVPAATWDVTKNFKRVVELNKLYAKSQKELEEVNTSLEDRVKEGIEHIRQKDQQMLEQSRLAQMGEMLSMIAHQWRQPLSTITATTGSISLHIQLEDCNKEYIEDRVNNINILTQHLSTTITDFRNFFKPDKEKTPTSLNEIVLGSLKIIGSSLEAQGVTIETFLESKGEFLSFPNELKQVVLNILKNAQDVLADKEIKNPRLLIKTVDTDEGYELSITDNAGGISEEVLGHIFDPYFTTKHQSDGTGLGLYMSKMIVEDHCNGHLKVENTSEGACFYLLIFRA